jgi:hypothetical protein
MDAALDGYQTHEYGDSVFVERRRFNTQDAGPTMVDVFI